MTEVEFFQSSVYRHGVLWVNRNIESSIMSGERCSHPNWSTNSDTYTSIFRSTILPCVIVVFIQMSTYQMCCLSKVQVVHEK